MFIGKIRQDRIFSIDRSHPIFRDCILFVVNDGKSDVNLINNEQPVVSGRVSAATRVGRAYRGTATTDGLTFDNTTGNFLSGFALGMATKNLLFSTEPK